MAPPEAAGTAPRHARDPTDPVLPRSRRDALTWDPLGLYAAYRLVLALGLAAYFHLGHDEALLGSHQPRLFAATALIYLLLALAAAVAVRARRPDYRVQATAQVLTDIGLLTVLMYASGGLVSGLGILLAVTVAAGALLMPGRTAFLFAALATLAVLAEQGLDRLLTGLDISAGYGRAGIMGVAFFATAALAHFLAQRLRDTEALAARQGVDLANLAQLNEHIIHQLQAGIVVVDRDDRVRLMNDTAWRLLGLPAGPENRTLAAVCTELAERLQAWRAGRADGGEPLRPAAGGELLARFRSLGTGTLIHLEDTAALAHQAQQMKLAALGRLTASIAHEIRNPLGAISHAAQLLEESPALADEDKRMSDIIRQQSQRVNAIIEDVLHLSRRQPVNPQPVALGPWLREFVQELAAGENSPTGGIDVEVEPEDMTLRFDRGHLHQVLWNLCSNALRHAGGADRPARVTLRAGRDAPDTPAWLEVIDNGPGVDPETAGQMFEPFFTTGSAGTGLGLYIARELCERNGARLEYVAVPAGGSCFRVSFEAEPAGGRL